MSGLVRSVRWLVIPAAVFLLVMVGLALVSAPQPESGERSQPSPEPEPEPSPQPQPARTRSASTVEAPTVTISSEAGVIEVRFDPDGVARASVEGQDGEFDLVQGTGSGVRLTDDGGDGPRLEPVPPGVIGPDDLGLTPTDNGVDLHAPTNPLVELRPDGEFGGVSATQFDGTDVTTLSGEDGVVVLNDGTTIDPIEAPGSGDGILVAVDPREMPWRWIFSAIAGVAIASALTGYLLHRNHVEPNFAVTQTLDWASDGTEDIDGFLERLANDPDPTRAIRLAFNAVERGLSGLPVRREEETPFEWHRRASDTVPAVETTLGRICDLYAKARFAPGQATDEDRNSMIDHVRRLVHGTHTPQPAGPVDAG